MTSPAIPATLAQTAGEVWGAEGRAWLEKLPALLADAAERWSLTVLPPFPNLSYNYVAPALDADGTPLVIKAGVPRAELTREIEALRAYAGQGSARLLEADARQGLLLLERLEPGTPLSALEDDDEAARIAARVMQQLWRPLPARHPFRPVGEWAAGLQRLRKRFAGGSGPLPAGLVDLAEQLFRDLLASAGPPVLLHGDLHHENILAARRGPWLAIDPKGVCGEAEYEAGALLRNPIPRLLALDDLRPLLARRIDLLVEVLGFDRQRLIAWGAAQAVLSAWWSVEDHGDGLERPERSDGWDTAIAVAGSLAALL